MTENEDLFVLKERTEEEQNVWLVNEEQEYLDRLMNFGEGYYPLFDDMFKEKGESEPGRA